MDGSERRQRRAALGTWTDEVYSSPTASFNSATAHDLGGFPAPSTLDAGASYTQTQSVTLSSASAGDSFIIVVADNSQSQAESDYTDNAGVSAAISLSAAALPMLAIAPSSFTAPASAALGDSVAVSWSVQNKGAVPTTSPWSDELYVSDSSTFDSSAQLLGAYSAPIAGSLAAGASYSQSVEVALPYTQTGSRFLLLVADGDGGQAISGATPIVAASAIALSAPDLVASVKSAPATAILGSPFNVSWTVTNTSSVPAKAAWQDAVYVSSSPTFDPLTATLLTSVNAPSTLAAGASYTSAATVNLPSMPAGTAYLYFVADVNNEQGKLNESVDNVASSPISVSGPNLAVAIDSAPASAVVGNNAELALSWTVTNNSSTDAVSFWSDNVYLSTSPTLNLNNFSSYTNLGDVNEPVAGPLAAGGSYTQNRTFTVPNFGSGAGAYYLVVATNQDGEHPVTGTAGETASSPINVTLPAVNLVVTQVTPPASNLIAGGNYTLGYTVQNQGSDAAAEADWNDTIYLSGKQTLDSTAIAIGTYNFFSSSPLSAGDSYTASATFTIPSTADSGPQYLLIVPDQSQVQSESNTNNAYAVQITVNVPDVKLATAITSSPPSAVIGTTIPVAWTVTNDGTAATTSLWYDAVYLSSSSTFNNAAIALGDFYVGSPPLPLGAGESYSLAESVTLYSGVVPSPGNYYLLVRASVFNPQSQTDSSLDVASVPITVTGASSTTTPDVDLIVSSATAPASGVLGQTVPVSFTVKNQGTNATTSTWDDYVYLSSTPTVNNYSEYVGSFVNASPLSAGSTYTQPETLTLPTRASAGNEYLVFVTNQFGASGGQSEINYNNNSYAVPISITEPDLSVTTGSFIGAAIEGAQVTVNWTVKNLGAAAASGTWFDAIYLSDSPVLGAGSQVEIRSVSEASHSPLSPQTSYSISQSITLPGDTVGARYLLVVADVNNNQGDPDRTNNFFAIPITLTAPNLAVSNVSATPASVETGNGAALNIQWTATNTSTINTSQGWEDEVFLSPTPYYDPSTATTLAEAPSRTDLTAGSSYTTDLTNVAISNIAPGSYYVLVVVNQGYVYALLNGELQFYSGQPESDDSDNVAAVAETLTTPGVTLAVSNAHVGSMSLVVGQSVNVSFQVNNQGSEAAQNSWEDAVYVSTNSTFDSSAQEIAFLSSQSPLLAGTSYTQSSNLTVPQYLAPGQYYLFFVANENRLQAETSYAGDVSAPILITINAPDLVIAVNNPPTVAEQGQQLSVSYTVTNNSSYNTSAPEWFDYAYLSSNPAVDSTSQFLSFHEYVNSPPLTAGQSYTASQNFTLPTTVTAGQTYYLLFFANEFAEQGVSNPADGFEAVPVTIAAAGVNLQVAAGSVSVAAPAVPSIGAPMTVDWSIDNVGNQTANGPWSDYVYISRSGTFDSTATLLSETSAPAASLPLAAGGSYDQSATFSLPTGFEAGNYYIYVKANGNAAQAESTTADDVSAGVPVTLATPDLQVSSVTAPPAAVWGSTIPLSWTVQNNGAGAATGAWYDAVYVSSSPQFDSSAQLVADFYEGQTVAAGGQYSDTENVFLTGIGNPVTGPAYFLVVPNYGSVLNESNAANTAGASDQAVFSAPALEVDNATAPAAGVAGGSVVVSWMVTNTSSVDAPAQWFDKVFLSPDNLFDDRAQFIAEFAAPTNPLTAGDSYTQPQNVTLPLIYTGPEYLIIVVDANNSQPQTNAANDVAVVPIDVSAANLTVTSVTAPPSINLGDPTSVSWTVQNTGTSSADEQWIDAVFYSKKNFVDSSAVLLTTVPEPANSPLAAGDSYTQSTQVTLPSGVAAGGYYILVDTNVLGNQPETNESDNTAASSLVTVTGADLSVSTAGAPGGADFGQSFTVNWNVLNNGNGSADGSWTDGIYISTETTFDSSAVLLDRVSSGGNSPLAAGASYNQSDDVTVPLTLQSATGGYYLYVVTDDRAQQVETNENNNVSAAIPIEVTVPALPDLVPGSLTAPANGYNGQQVTVSWIDSNNGTVAAVGPWTDNIYLATDSQGDNAVLVGQATYPGTLGIGQQTVQLTQPIDLPSTPGTYYLKVIADAVGINEGPLAANGTTVDATPITVVQEPLPDLVVTSITPPGNGVLSGTIVPVTYTVTNRGDAPTNSTQWLDAIFLSQSPALSLSGNDFSDGFEILAQPLGVPVFATNPSYLLPGQSYSQTVNVPIPVSASNTWYVYVVANRSFFHSILDNFIYTGPVAESNSINDMTASAAFNVSRAPSPDLSVAPVRTPPGAFSGEPLSVSWTVTNNGPGIAIGQPLPQDLAGKSPIRPALPADSTWTDEVFMSPDATLDSQAVSLGAFTHFGALNSGGSYTNIEQVTLPVGVSGSFYFIVETDADGQVYETGEINATPGAITVNLTPPPDLQTTILDAPTAALASHALTFKYQVANIGAGPTVPLNSTDVWTDAYYLSPTPAYNSSTAILLGSLIYGGNLAAGGSYTNTITETLPDALSGNYYLIVDSDNADAIFELDLASKFGVAASAIQVASKPADLVVTAAGGPASGQAGGAVMLNWTVANQGAGDTAVSSWQDNVYADTGSTLDSHAVLLGSYKHTGLLGAGGSYSQSQIVTLPISLSGPYNLFVVTNEPVPVPGQSAPPLPVYESNFNNDTSTAVAVNVVQTLADLQATQVVAPSSVQAGGSYAVQWTAQNNGAGATNSNYWFDDVWISTKSTLNSGGNDIYLGTVQHTNPLAAGGSYTASDQVTVPASLPPGSYYFIVAVDRPLLPTSTYDTSTENIVYESNENNNVAALAISVTPGPELVVSQVAAPGAVDVNQPLTVGWTVTNTGSGGTGNVPIQDSVYLSFDQVFSNSAIYVGTVTHIGGLSSGGSYTQSAALPLPSGRQGTFYVFVIADTNQTVYEQNASDAQAFDATPLVVQAVPPADLVAGTVTIPDDSVAGENITIQYQVSNNGTNPANGSWTDSLYLSPTQTWSTSDPLLGTVAEDRDLAPGDSYTGSLTAPLPGVAPGSYYVIVRTNILDTIPETTLANNLSASLTNTSVTVPALTLGVPATGTLSDKLSAFYQVTAPAGDTLQVAFTTPDSATLNELYVSYGAMPSRSQADFSFQQLAANQTVTVPTTQAGTYYILVYGSDLPFGFENYSLTATAIPFSVTGASPPAVGNTGPATIEITGARFDRGTTFSLVAPGGRGGSCHRGNRAGRRHGLCYVRPVGSRTRRVHGRRSGREPRRQPSGGRLDCPNR